MSDNDFKNDWGPPDATLASQVEVSWDHHQANQEQGAQKDFGVLFELELWVEVKLSDAEKPQENYNTGLRGWKANCVRGSGSEDKTANVESQLNKPHLPPVNIVLNVS